MKRLYLLSVLSVLPATLLAQSAINAYRFSQPDMKGTARFMSMGGAFGALGGDLSTLSQNPAGIGVYRSNEIGFTLNLDCQSSKTTSPGFSMTDSQTKFLLNNIGGVATLKLPSSVVPNLNIGFTYNKGASFNSRYNGAMNLSNSMSNYIAGIANGYQLTVMDLTTTDNYNPYNPTDGGYAAPWLAILGYDSHLINPTGDPDSPHWKGQWGDLTSGTGNFAVETSGSVDEYNVALGGNISNVVYWGMNFDIVNLNYRMDAFWGENLSNAEIDLDNGNGPTPMNARWNMRNTYRATGSGFNYQLGVIIKPIQELRIGLAFHTPTWYNITESYYASTDFSYGSGPDAYSNTAITDDGYPGTNYVSFKTPWKFMASVAGVIGSRFIISADYEWTGYKDMSFSMQNNDYYYDDPWDWDYYSAVYSSNDPYYETNQDVKNYYQSTNTLRLGAEFRVTPRFSVRAGYSYVSSPVQDKVKDGKEVVYTSGTLPNFRLDNSTNYITCGLGYKFQNFYVDAAYVYKHMSSTYHAYTGDPRTPEIPSPSSKLTLDNSQIVLSCGFKF